MQYGSEVGPQGPQQDMHAIDTIVGTIGDRSSDQAQFTGGAGPAGEHGLGGSAEPMDGDVLKERIGF
jgi:hypothetical protein